MELKKEWSEISIGGGRTKTRKIKDMTEAEKENLYDNGFQDFFVEIIESVEIIDDFTEEEIKKNDIEDDFNK